MTGHASPKNCRSCLNAVIPSLLIWSRLKARPTNDKCVIFWSIRNWRISSMMFSFFRSFELRLFRNNEKKYFVLLWFFYCLLFLIINDVSFCMDMLACYRKKDLFFVNFKHTNVWMFRQISVKKLFWFYWSERRTISKIRQSWFVPSRCERCNKIKIGDIFVIMTNNRYPLSNKNAKLYKLRYSILFLYYNDNDFY